MYTAFDSLSATQQSDYLSLKMIHSAAGLDRYLEQQGYASTESDQHRDYSKTVWPLVRAHPISKRRALYFGNQITIGVVGWDDQRAINFVHELTEHACQQSHQYRHHWRVGDAVLWDNRRVLHAGTNYDTQHSRRLMHRTTWRETQPIRMIGENDNPM